MMARMDELEQAVEAIASARGILVTAGAGMGVDSGLPDFRGPEGFWRAYPPYRELGLRFEELAQPGWFERDPSLAWGFYGHRLTLYRDTEPHEGFAILRRWAEARPEGAFVFTSNVDGHFEKAGFAPERIVECHGSLMFAQCARSCGVGIFEADFEVEVDPKTFRAAEPLPKCPRCGALARPNVLMFDDWDWDGSRVQASEERLEAWLGRLGDGLVIVEAGAGTRVPTVRWFGERVASLTGARLVRINLREPQGPPSSIPLAMRARDALEELDRRLGSR